MKLSLKEFFLHEGDLPKGDEPLSRPPGTKKIKGLPKGDEPLKAEHADPTEPVDAGSTIWSDPTQPAKVKKFSSRDGVLSIDLQEMFNVDEMGGKGSGRPKGSKNKPKPGSNIKTATPADPASLPDDLDDLEIDTSAFDEPAGGKDLGNIDQSDITGMGAKQHAPDQPSDPSGFEPQDDDPFARGADDFGSEEDLAKFLNDPNLGKGVDVAKQDPAAAAPKKKKEPRMAGPSDTEWQASPEHQAWLDAQDFDFGPGPAKPGREQFWRDVEDNELETMSWEELEEAEPEIAADIGAEFPDLKDPGDYAHLGTPNVKRERGVIFAFDKVGDLVMLSGGDRYKWDADNADWTPMDKGE